MLHSAEVVNLVADMLEKYEIKNVVLDPVMVSTSGHRLIEENAVEVIKSRLTPLTRVITPNIPEAEIITGFPISSEEDLDEITEKYKGTYTCFPEEESFETIIVIPIINDKKY